VTRRRPRARVASLALCPADEARVEALTVAMALAPGVYARNRMFDLFANVAVRRAKARAATLRGIVKHLARASALTLESEAGGFVLRYEIPVMSLSRVVELTSVELATLRVLAARAGAPCAPSLAAGQADRVLVDTTLARLLDAGGDTGDLARAARNSSAPPPPPG
jgi:hypothetical protein